MKRILVILAIAAFFSCKDNKEQPVVQASSEGDNAELIEIYKNDQSERSSADVDWGELYVQDSLRRIRVQQLLDSGKVKTGKDYARAAMVFQHGKDSTDYGMAVRLMKLAIEKDTSLSKSLFAAATDRYLLSKGEPQIYGTQYMKMGDGPWELEEIDTTQVTDAERKELGIRTLAEQRQHVMEMNREDNQ